MNSSVCNWTLVQIEPEKGKKFWPLSLGSTKLGRGPDNPIRLTHDSVSRNHAEVVCDADGISIRDLSSRNGILVNGVPRQKAALQPGDALKIGIFRLELLAAPPSASLPAEPPVEEATERVTVDQVFRLPDQNRELHTLFHVCSWLTDGIEEKDFISKCLRLLVEAFSAQEAHLYGSDGQLQAVSGQESGKPVIKLAAFLARKFQESPEATIISGASIARHQQRIGEFNYLVGPLRSSQSAQAAVPFLVLLRPVELADFTTANRVLLQLICQIWVRGQARAIQVQDLHRENAQLKQKAGISRMLGESQATRSLRERAARAAATNVTVLLQGETGSGKEVVAQFIHQNSPRKDGPYIKVNCAAIPDTLIESELFGHLRGAFTDARRDRKGKFAQADHGTLLLDEIGEMPLNVQAKVLRAIENKEIEPVGCETVVSVDVRIIAATNRDLAEMARAKQFREDLYHRLNVVPVPVPPLRERLEDIAMLAPFFLDQFCAENGLAEMSFAPDAIAQLRRHSWPGNVRELRNVVQRCAASTEEVLITAKTVESHLQV